MTRDCCLRFSFHRPGFAQSRAHEEEDLGVVLVNVCSLHLSVSLEASLMVWWERFQLLASLQSLHPGSRRPLLVPPNRIFAEQGLRLHHPR